MQLPPANAASPRPAGPGPGSSPTPQPGAAAGFEAVMSGMLASDSKAPHETPREGTTQQGTTQQGTTRQGTTRQGTTQEGTTQQAPDGGAQDKPAGDGPGMIARAAKPQASKAAKSTVDAVGGSDPAAAVGVAALAAGLVSGAVPAAGGAAGGAVPAAGGIAAGAAPGTAALQATDPVVSAPVKDGVVSGTALAKTVADSSAAANPLAEVPKDTTQAAPAGTGVGAPRGGALDLATTHVPAAPPQPGKPGQGPVQPSPIAAGPLRPGSPPTQPLRAVIEQGTTEQGTSAIPTQAGGPGAAVVLPVGKSATPQDRQQQDPLRVLGQDTRAAAVPGLPAGLQAGAPATAPPAPTLPDVPSPVAPGTATPALHTEQAKLLPQVSGTLFSLASAAPGSHLMTVKLSPEDLGPLTVRAHIEGAAVRIELFAPGEAGREAVRSILPELRRGLGESGFGASLDLSEHSAPPDAWAGASDPRSGARDRRPADSPAFPRGRDSEPVRLPRTAVVLPGSNTSSLDILV